MYPTVSFICPTFNRAEMLEECVAPIADAVDCNWEVVIADDGSTDSTTDIAHDLIARFGGDRIVFLPSKRNDGAPAARNRGLRTSRGSLIAFVDSDDVPISEGFAALEEILHEDSETDFVYGKVRLTDEHLVPTGSEVGSDFPRRPREIAGYHWHTMGALYRRSFLEKLGPWNEALTGSQDWEFQARAKMAGKGRFIDVMVGNWRQHDRQRVGTKGFRLDYSVSAMVAFESVIEQAEKLGLFDKELGKRFALKWLRLGLELGANGHHEERKVCFHRAMYAASNSVALQRAIWFLQWTPRGLDMHFRRGLDYCANSAAVASLRQRKN